jgi:hypothetical protein
MNLLKLSGVAMGLLALVACSSEETDSSFIKTEGIWANIKIESDGQRSRVVTELNVSGATGTNVVLGSQDSLSVTAQGQTKTLLKDTDFLDIDYQEYIDVTADDSLFTIALHRQVETDATQSTVTLPTNFEIHGPLSSDVFHLNEYIQVDWDGISIDEQIQLTVSSNCKDINGSDILQVVSFSVADNSQYDILPSELEMFKNASVDLTKDCTINITLTRTKEGQADSHFKSGSKIYATQYRRIEGIRINN